MKKLRNKLGEIIVLKGGKPVGKELESDQLLNIESIKSLEAHIAKVVQKISELSLCTE